MFISIRYTFSPISTSLALQYLRRYNENNEHTSTSTTEALKSIFSVTDGFWVAFRLNAKYVWVAYPMAWTWKMRIVGSSQTMVESDTAAV